MSSMNKTEWQNKEAFGMSEKNNHHNRPFDAERKDKMKQATPPPSYKSHNLDPV
jgi:hypothetical protein